MLGLHVSILYPLTLALPLNITLTGKQNKTNKHIINTTNLSVCSAVPTDELWIGLNDQRIQNLFEWSDRTHVTFTKWLAGEPSHIINRMEDCVLIKGKVGPPPILVTEPQGVDQCAKFNRSINNPFSKFTKVMNVSQSRQTPYQI